MDMLAQSLLFLKGKPRRFGARLRFLILLSHLPISRLALLAWSRYGPNEAGRGGGEGDYKVVKIEKNRSIKHRDDY